MKRALTTGFRKQTGYTTLVATKLCVQNSASSITNILKSETTDGIHITEF
jgi:hypothetical protein